MFFGPDSGQINKVKLQGKMQGNACVEYFLMAIHLAFYLSGEFPDGYSESSPDGYLENSRDGGGPSSG